MNRHFTTLSAIALTMSSISLGALAQVNLGLGPLRAGMSISDATTALRAQNYQVQAPNARTLESVLTDSATSETIKVQLEFSDSAVPTLLNVKFRASGRGAFSQYLVWLTRTTKDYGGGVSRKLERTFVQELFCHAKNISIGLALWAEETELAFYAGPNDFSICSTAPTRRDMPIAYADRPVVQPPAPQADNRAPTIQESSKPSVDINAMHRELYRTDPEYRRKTDDITARASGATPEMQRRNERTYQQLAGSDIECLRRVTYRSSRTDDVAYYTLQNTCNRTLIMAVVCDAEIKESRLSLAPQQEFRLTGMDPQKCRYEVPYVATTR